MPKEAITPQSVYKNLREASLSLEKHGLVNAVLDYPNMDKNPETVYLERWRGGLLTPAEVALISVILDNNLSEETLSAILDAMNSTRDHIERLTHAIQAAEDLVAEKFNATPPASQEKPQIKPKLLGAAILRKRHEMDLIQREHIKAVMLLLDEKNTEADFEQCIEAIQEALKKGKINAANMAQFNRSIENIVKLSPNVLRRITSKEDLEGIIQTQIENENAKYRRAMERVRREQDAIDRVPPPQPAKIRTTEEIRPSGKETWDARVKKMLRTMFGM